MLRRIIRRLRKRGRGTAQTTSAPAVVESQVIEPEPEDEAPEVDVEIDTAQLKAWIAEETPFTLVDIREPHELRLGYAAPALLLRMNDIPSRVDELPSKDTTLVIYCAAGSRSFGVAHWLREQGWAEAWSLESGFYGVTEAGFEVARPDERSD